MSGSAFMPHGHCYFWTPDVLWMHVGSDLVIAASYFVIPVMLFRLHRARPDLGFRWVLVLFGVFILACGTTHLFDVWTTWNPWYRMEGAVKVVTALASAATAIVVWPLLPTLVALPSPEVMRETNASLRAEIARRERVEQELRDLTDTLERRVAARTAALKRSNSDLADFAHVVSHDLKTPLRGLATLASWIAEEEPLSEEGQTHARLLMDRAVRLQRMVDGVLAYARADQPEGDDMQVALGAVVATVATDLGLEHCVRCTTTDATLASRGASVRRVLQNLLENAAQHGATRVWVSSSRRGDGRVLVRVEDNGPGVPEAMRERIFDLFHRADPASPSTGIGLSVVRKIVRNAGGQVSVRDSERGGAAFVFDWPGRAHG